MALIVKDKGEKTPHLALTHNELQGGAANKRNVSLLMKGEASLTDEIVKALEKVLGGVFKQEEVEKAAFYNQTRRNLESAVREKYAEDDEWCYVEDFNDELVVFCNKEGIFSSAYSVVNGGVVLADMATPVTAVVSYEPTEGKMLLSEDAEDKLEEGVYGLVVKSLSNPETIAHFEQVFKSINERKIALKQEIEKAVADAVAELQEVIKAKDAEIEVFKTAQKQAVVKARKEALDSVVGTEKSEELMSVCENMDDQAFSVIVKSLGEAVKAQAESDMFVEKGVAGEADNAQKDKLAQLIEAKYGDKK